MVAAAGRYDAIDAEGENDQECPKAGCKKSGTRRIPEKQIREKRANALNVKGLPARKERQPVAWERM